MTTTRTVRILLADDHGIVRQGLRAVLSRDARLEVGGRDRGDGPQSAVRLAETLEPDIVIMDITMPQLNGIDAAAQIVKRNPRTGVIILSMHLDETYLMRASGRAKGYLPEGFEAEVDLVRAVRWDGAPREVFLQPGGDGDYVFDDYCPVYGTAEVADSYSLAIRLREGGAPQLLAEGGIRIKR